MITPESAYWIGFLFADGCLRYSNGGAPEVILEVKETDRAHIEKFRTFLKSEHAITKVSHRTALPGQVQSAERKSVSFRVRSHRLADALVARGMSKKGVDRAPSIEIENSPDFWRGCVDGDGVVRIHVDPRHDYRFPHLILCGHMPLLLKYQQFLERHGVRGSITEVSTIHEIRVMGSGARIMIDVLYRNAAVALDRKMQTAQAILQEFGQ